MIDRERFLKPRLGERTIVVDGVGTIRVRSLSRKEVAHLRTFVDDPDAGEIWTLAQALVDPALDETDVREWRDAAPHAEVDAVLDAVLDVSGLKETALKEAVKTFRGRPGETPGIPPGQGAGDDSGRTAGADE